MAEVYMAKATKEKLDELIIISLLRPFTSKIIIKEVYSIYPPV